MGIACIIVVVLVGAALLVALLFRKSKPQVIAPKMGPELERIVAQVPALQEGFLPVPWLRSRHAQTIVGSSSRMRIPVTFRRELFRLEDGGQVGLDWLEPEPAADDTPVLVVIHGVNGGSRERYIQHYLVNVRKAFDCRCVVMVLRGLGGVPLTSPRPYNAGDTGDIRAVVKAIHTRYPKAPLLGAGFSLGANVMAKYVGEEGEKCVLHSVICVSCPFDLQRTTDYLEAPGLLNRRYTENMGRGLVRCAKKNAEMLAKAPKADIKLICTSRTSDEFTDHAARMFFGFSGSKEYYQRLSSLPVIHNTAVPTLYINAVDDPMVGPAVIEEARAELKDNSSTVLVVTPCGGHLGFVEARGMNPMRWAKNADSWIDRVAPQFYKASLSEKQHY